MACYYADTYALVEILRGSSAYERYAGEELVTSEFNLLELAYALTRATRLFEYLSYFRNLSNIINTLETLLIMDE